MMFDIGGCWFGTTHEVGQRDVALGFGLSPTAAYLGSFTCQSLRSVVRNYLSSFDHSFALQSPSGCNHESHGKSQPRPKTCSAFHLWSSGLTQRFGLSTSSYDVQCRLLNVLFACFTTYSSIFSSASQSINRCECNSRNNASQTRRVPCRVSRCLILQE